MAIQKSLEGYDVLNKYANDSSDKEIQIVALTSLSCLYYREKKDEASARKNKKIDN